MFLLYREKGCRSWNGPAPSNAMVCPSVAHGRLARGAAAEGHVSSARSMALAALSYSASTSVKEKSIYTYTLCTPGGAK